MLRIIISAILATVSHALESTVTTVTTALGCSECIQAGGYFCGKKTVYPMYDNKATTVAYGSTANSHVCCANAPGIDGTACDGTGTNWFTSRAPAEAFSDFECSGSSDKDTAILSCPFY